jgi:hypothetical protein
MVQQHPESLLIADDEIHLHTNENLLYDDGIFGEDELSMDESITKSYNQKLKDETNYLAK